MDHPGPSGQRETTPAGHRTDQRKRGARRPAPAFVREPLPFERLRGEAGPSRGYSRSPGRPGQLQHLRTGAQHPTFPEAWHVCGEVAFAPYALPGSIKLGERIAEQFGSKARPRCVVLENHGVVVGGETLAQAFERFETLEFTAQITLNARLLGQVNYLSEDQIELSKSPRTLLPEGAPQTASSREKERRKEICDFIHRAYEHRLVTSTWGSFSARVDADAFVVTPSHVDRCEMGLEDLLFVHDGKHVADQRPSRAAGLHRAIYRAHPEIQAVVNALPLNATAFSVSEIALDTRTIPESYLFLKDVRKIAFEHQFGDGAEVAALVGPRTRWLFWKTTGRWWRVAPSWTPLTVWKCLKPPLPQSFAAGRWGPLAPWVRRSFRNSWGRFPAFNLNSEIED